MSNWGFVTDSAKTIIRRPRERTKKLFRRRRDRKKVYRIGRGASKAEKNVSADDQVAPRPRSLEYTESLYVYVYRGMYLHV